MTLDVAAPQEGVPPKQTKQPDRPTDLSLVAFRPASGAGSHDIGRTRQIDEFLARRSAPTPFIVIDLQTVRANWAAFRACFPQARIFYAVKANPAAEVIAALAALGADFDLASEGEISRCRALGIDAERLSFGNTIKREAEIARAHEFGIDLFAFDSADELAKLAHDL